MPMVRRSNLVRAVGIGTPSGCFKDQAKLITGINSYMALPIDEAQAKLALASAQGTQNVMIILSDGQMNLKLPSDVASGKWASAYPAGMNSGSGQCGQTVTQAGVAKAAGTLVYSVAYVMHNEPAENVLCPGDLTYTPCTEMQALASDPTKFFTTDSSICRQNITNLATDLPIIMKQIATTLHKARLIPVI